jgi:hypothetical protein
MPNICRTGLASLDGTDQSFVVQGSVSDAIARRPLGLAPCGTSEAPQTLSSGDHRFVTTKGLDSAIDIDAMELRSVPIGQYTTTADTPSTTVTSTGKNSYKIDIANASDPFWLVLGQSLSNGWKATVRGGESLGDPTLIDGFANGWMIDPAVTGTTFTVDITWAPQKVVWGGLATSGLWFIGLCAAAIVIAWRRRQLVRKLPEATDPTLVTSELANPTTTRMRLGVLVGMTLPSRWQLSRRSSSGLDAAHQSQPLSFLVRLGGLSFSTPGSSSGVSTDQLLCGLQAFCSPINLGLLLCSLSSPNPSLDGCSKFARRARKAPVRPTR